MKIAVDVDEVLVALSESFFSYHNKKFGTSIIVDNMNHYRYDKHLGATLKQIFEKVQEFYKTEDFRNMPVLPNAKQVISELSKTHELIVITSRYGAGRKFTKQWINKEFPGMFSDILFSSEKHYEEKYKKAKQIKEKAQVCFDNKIDLIIDDSLAHALECAEKGIKVLLFNQPWNQTDNLPDNITRVKSWKEIPEKINY